MIRNFNFSNENIQVLLLLKDKNDIDGIRSLLLNLIVEWYNKIMDPIFSSNTFFEDIFEDLPSIKELYNNSNISKINLREINIDIFDLLNTDLFGKLYSEYMPRDWKNSNGYFFTPVNVAEWMIQSSNAIYDPNTSHLVLDICVGSGRFFIAYMKQLSKEITTKCENHEFMYSLIRNHLSRLYGFDKDPFSIFLTRFHIAIYCYFLLSPNLTADEFTSCIKIIKMNIQVFDVLKIPKNDLKKFFSSNNDLFSKIFYKNAEFKDGFAYIFANPPYMKIQLTNDQKKYYKKSIYGHVNSYGIFFHLAINLLMKDYGQLWFITPESFRSGLYFQNLRKLILEECIFRKLILIKSRNSAFPDVLQGVGIVNLLKKNRELSNINHTFLQIFTVDSTEDIEISSVLLSFEVPSSSIIYTIDFIPYYIFGTTLKSYDIFQHVIKRSIPLKDLPEQFIVITGQIVWNRVKPLLLEQQLTDQVQSVKPLIWSDNYDAYSFNWQGKLKRPRYILDDPQISSFKLEGQIILVKRVTAKEQSRRLVATQVPSLTTPYFVENHSNVLLSEKATSEDKLFLIAYLNSKLADYIFRLINGNTQVSATELRIFPIIIVPENMKQSIISNTYELLFSTKDSLQKQSYSREIDELLFNSIELSLPLQREILKEVKDIW